MSKPIYTDLDFNSVSKILNLPDATLAQQPATFAQLNAAIEGLQDKGFAAVATSSNINLASPGAALDGVTLTSGVDYFLALAQTTASENGLYLFNGSATPATRSVKMNLSAEFNNALVKIIGGTSAGVTYRQTALNPTVGTTSIAFTTFGSGASAATTSTPGIVQLATQGIVDTGTNALQAVTPSTLKAAAFLPKKFSSTFGDGTSTQYDITHSLGSLDVIVEVNVVSSGISVLCDVTRFSTTVVRLNFTSAPASNALRVTVIG